MLKKIDHIGIIVKDLDRALARYREGLGLACSGTKEIPDAGVRVAFFPIGDTTIELVEFSRLDENVDELLRNQPQGISHICFEVDNLKESLEELTGKGFRLLKGFPRRGAHGMVAFFHPDGLEGALFEICELDH